MSLDAFTARRHAASLNSTDVPAYAQSPTR